MFWVGKAAFEFVRSVLGTAFSLTGDLLPFDPDIVLAGRGAFAERAAHKLKRAVLTDDAHDHVVLHGVAAFATEKDGRAPSPRPLLHHLTANRIEVVLVPPR